MKHTDLKSLADAANKEHEAAERCDQERLNHYRRAGEALLKAKEKCSHGNWGKWFCKHIRFSLRTAERYMQFAKTDVYVDFEHQKEVWDDIAGNAASEESATQQKAKEAEDKQEKQQPTATERAEKDLKDQFNKAIRKWTDYLKEYLAEEDDFYLPELLDKVAVNVSEWAFWQRKYHRVFKKAWAKHPHKPSLVQPIVHRFLRKKLCPDLMKNFSRLSDYAVEQLDELIESEKYPLSWYQQLRLDGRLGRLKGEIDRSQMEPEIIPEVAVERPDQYESEQAYNESIERGRRFATRIGELFRQADE